MNFPIRKKFLFFLLIVNLIALPVLFYWNTHRQTSYANQSPVSLPSYGAVADFTLIEKSGGELSLDNLKGNVWVANFIFTHCAGQCPTMSLKMSGLQSRLPQEARLVSFTVDPKNDTPKALLDYAKRYNAQGERWLFLTGEEPTIREVLKGFYVNTGEDPNLHSLRFVLVDSNGLIRGYYDSTEEEAVKKLLQDTKLLMEEESRLKEK